MIETRLIFVEGLPGLGKTTCAYAITERLQSLGMPAKFFEEHQAEHPLNVGGDLLPAGDVVGEAYFQHYTPQRFVEESLERWQSFVKAALQDRAVSVLDSHPYQNAARLLLQMNASVEDIATYIEQVEAAAQPLGPVLIYFTQAGIEQALQNMESIGAQRGEAWTSYIVALVTHSPYAVARGLSGLTGVSQFLMDYKRLFDTLVSRTRLPNLRLENCSGNWEPCYRKIEVFLQIEPQG